MQVQNKEGKLGALSMRTRADTSRVRETLQTVATEPMRRQEKQLLLYDARRISHGKGCSLLFGPMTFLFM